MTGAECLILPLCCGGLALLVAAGSILALVPDLLGGIFEGVGCLLEAIFGGLSSCLGCGCLLVVLAILAVIGLAVFGANLACSGTNIPDVCRMLGF